MYSKKEDSYIYINLIIFDLRQYDCDITWEYLKISVRKPDKKAC